MVILGRYFHFITDFFTVMLFSNLMFWTIRIIEVQILRSNYEYPYHVEISQGFFFPSVNTLALQIYKIIYI